MKSSGAVMLRKTEDNSALRFDQRARDEAYKGAHLVGGQAIFGAKQRVPAAL